MLAVKKKEINTTILINTESLRPVELPKGSSLINVSDCGKYCLLAPRKANNKKGKVCVCVCVCMCVCMCVCRKHFLKN